MNETEMMADLSLPAVSNISAGTILPGRLSARLSASFYHSNTLFFKPDDGLSLQVPLLETRSVLRRQEPHGSVVVDVGEGVKSPVALLDHHRETGEN